LLYELWDAQQECALQRRWRHRADAAQRNCRRRQAHLALGWILVPDDEAAWDVQLSTNEAGHDGSDAVC
jgi:hypothetical protein